jgi:hypothetical protein
LANTGHLLANVTGHLLDNTGHLLAHTTYWPPAGLHTGHLLVNRPPMATMANILAT